MRQIPTVFVTKKATDNAIFGVLKRLAGQKRRFIIELDEGTALPWRSSSS